MSMAPFPFGETVTVLRHTSGTDAYGDPIEGDDAEVDIEGCFVHPGNSTEQVVIGRDPLEVDFTVLAPYGADIRRTDELRIRGHVYRVVSDPFDWKHPLTGWEPIKQVLVKRGEG